MDSFKGKLKFVLVIGVFLLIIALLVAGLLYVLFQPKTITSKDSQFLENNLPVTKYPITTPIDYTVVE